MIQEGKTDIPYGEERMVGRAIVFVAQEELGAVLQGKHLQDMYSNYSYQGRSYFIPKEISDLFKKEDKLLSRIKTTKRNPLQLGLDVKPRQYEKLKSSLFGEQEKKEQVSLAKDGWVNPIKRKLFQWLNKEKSKKIENGKVEKIERRKLDFIPRCENQDGRIEKKAMKRVDQQKPKERRSLEK